MSNTLIWDYIHRTCKSEKIKSDSVLSLVLGVVFLLWSVFAGSFVEMLLPLAIALVFNEMVIIYAASQRANRYCVWGVCLLNFCAAITQALLEFKMPLYVYAVALFLTVAVALALRIAPYNYMSLVSGTLAVALFGICLVLRDTHGARNWLIIGPVSIQVTEFAKLAYIIFVGTLFLSKATPAYKFWCSATVTAIITAVLLLISEFGTMLIIATSYVCAVMVFFKGKAVYKILTLLVVAFVMLLAFLGYSYGREKADRWLCPECSHINHRTLECTECEHKPSMVVFKHRCSTCRYTDWAENDSEEWECKICGKEKGLARFVEKVYLKLYTRASLTYDYEFQKQCGNAFHASQNLQAMESGGMFGNSKAIIYIPNIENDSVIAGMMNRLGFVFALVVLLGFFLVFSSITTVFSPLRFMAICVFVFQALYTFTGTINKLPMTGVGVPLLSDGGSNLSVSVCAICIMLSAIRNKEVIK